MAFMKSLGSIAVLSLVTVVVTKGLARLTVSPPSRAEIEAVVQHRSTPAEPSYAVEAPAPQKPIDITPPEFREPPRPGHPIKRRVNVPDRPCVYKDVMSDDDYRACGATPPH
jgi:hypothetical protein